MITKIWNGFNLKILTKQTMYNNCKTINNSNPKNPSIHHWPKTFPFFNANFQNSKIPKLKVPKSIYLITRSHFDQCRFLIWWQPAWKLPKLGNNCQNNTWSWCKWSMFGLKSTYIKTTFPLKVIFWHIWHVKKATK